MTDTRVTSMVVEVIRTAASTSGAGSSAGSATVLGVAPQANKQPVVCIIMS